MRLYVMRHAEALGTGENGVRSDAFRPLSPAGRQAAATIARQLRRLGVSPALVGASPLLRARQTAEIVAEELGAGGPPETLQTLAPGGSLLDLLDDLESRRLEAVLLVGHMPDLAELLSELVCGHTHAGLGLPTAGVACVAFERQPAIGRGILEWLAPPFLFP